MSAQQAQSFLEVEAKFSVSRSLPAPEITELPGVADIGETRSESLSAIYYDTKDLRLTRAKVTLRRRTGGHDDGWHIKLPSDLGRTELHAELQDPVDGVYTVPQHLLANVRSIIRNHPVQPIAQVDNQRTEQVLVDADGNPRAEFCDDNVTAWSLLPGGQQTSWREWEIELAGDLPGTDEGTDFIHSATQQFIAAGARVSASPSKLASALGDSIENAPLPASMRTADVDKKSPAAAVVKALAANRDKLVAYDPKVRADEWDSIHQMRVATRELRSHMETFHGIIGGPEIKHIEAELKLLASILGVARDAEVVEERWQSLLAAEDSDTLDDTTRGHIANDMGKEYARAHRKVVAALNSDRYLELLDSLDELLANPPVSSPEGEFPEAVPAAGEAAEGEAAVDTDESAEGEADASAATEITTSDIDSSSNQVAEASEEEEDAADAAGTDESDKSEQPDEADEAEPARKSKKEEKAAAKRAAKKASKEMEQVLAAHLHQAYTKLLKRHKKATKNWDNDKLTLHEREDYYHDMRKAAKKLRYAAEAAGSATKLKTKGLYAACKKMQSVLGDFQDSVTSRDKLLHLATSARRRGEDTFGYGLLYQRERAIGLEALKDYESAMKAINEAFKPLKKQMDK
ncbi:CYTH and CHAD domain-containing protein [Corynebacterium ammoniagenes]|uniref:CHAD domain protein n=1 Tax=Corynebacterium ammoniagenes DSM 20306 TaxID=649754 RepID=A0ABN0ABZ8_CORAM|nr:CYTH and CHAD domain-containing protein [Corynebacterium ammoniagenes]APT82243.1 metal-chelation protein CHAD [Corynebacterium ammoniagenes DSM 20306]AQS73337.1 CHAD domain-containing protein [Corynebacterium ammoniagenes]EFG80173.1 CHAD domain protein [Corynebacterium ammoniagenes DSM 20306]NMF31153.1 CYTH and CHAD domain-containing protein [Corynebacterium ammoniagenes]